MGFLVEFLRGIGTRRGSRAKFRLVYRPDSRTEVAVGHLTYDGSEWTFSYDDDYRTRRDLRPLEGFDDVSKTYRSSHLFPFFAVRIPDRQRPDIERLLRAKQISDPDAVDLLRAFGERAASSPGFRLLPESA
jgi:HipA-like protein